MHLANEADPPADSAICTSAAVTAAAPCLWHSSGNHAAALALAARARGIPAHIIVPRTAPQCKLDAVQEYGGSLVLCEPTLKDREAVCASVAARTGATLVPPYDAPAVIAGQGTIALELLAQARGRGARAVKRAAYHNHAHANQHGHTRAAAIALAHRRGVHTHPSTPCLLPSPQPSITRNATTGAAA